MPDGTFTDPGNIYGHGATLRHIAAKHFPNDGLDRWVLLEAANAFDQLEPLHHKLALIQQHLTSITEIDRPDHVDVRYMAMSLEKAGRWAAEAHHEEAALLKTASDVLLVWNDLGWQLDRLLEIAKDFQVLHGRPTGCA